MLSTVPVTPKSLDAYRPVVGDAAIDEILSLAAKLQGARVAHVNATAFGGGVAEILATLVPLMNDAGLHAEWQVIKGADEFFHITKSMHNSLQGMYFDWNPAARDIWLHYNRLNAELFDDTYDFVVIHDPQPAAIPAILDEQRGSHHGKWLWRCHIDLTDAQAELWDFLRGYVERYDAAIFTMKNYVKGELGVPRLYAIPPAIDPLSPKNVPLPEQSIREILARYGVDPDRPMITQISRFDPWKDPLGVVEVYQKLKHEFSGLQLVMIASMASDDPEGWSWYERLARRAGEDWDIHILSNLNGVGSIEVNAFQRAARVVIQKSTREGFGLVVSEALWKGRPVVAGNVGGIPLQVEDGKTGFLVNNTPECAEKVGWLLREPAMADQMGEKGIEYVRERFLTTRYLRDYLRMFVDLSDSEAPVATQASRTRS